MPYQLLADIVLVIHAVFIVYAVLGGLLVLRWKRLLWLHLPCLAWVILLEALGWYCPLTPLEFSLREAAGSAVYSDSFIDHYLMPLVYPAGLTRNIQIGLAVAVLLVNVLIYWLVWRLRPAARRKPAGEEG